MAISDRDRKLLWARSGDLCAFPGCHQALTQEGVDSPFPVGEEAHVVARTPDGPRGEDPLPRRERDKYANLLLLCPTHHAVVDNDTTTYTVAKLHEMKADHERWVRKSRSVKGPPAISVSKLPITGPDLFGRDEELALLDDAWDDPNTNIVAFVAFGGVGKSAIINEWIRRVGQDDHRGARRVFGWSFYSQGQREHTVSADQFIDSALRFFGDPKPGEGGPWDKGQRLAQLIREHPSILALDGLEPLQSAAEGGKINDLALEALLRELAHAMNGLCLLSSRIDFPEMSLSDDSGPARRVSLERLSTEAGSHLLRRAGVEGFDHEIAAVVEEYDGHALALVLLGEYLSKFLAGNVARRNLIPSFTDRTRAGRHAFRVLEAYDRTLAEEGMQAERALLRLVGLFDRPADKGCLVALRQPPAIQGITDAVVNLTDQEWREAVGTVRDLRLLSPAPSPDDGSLDAHPLTRQWYGQKLEQEHPEGFGLAHGRLYEYLRGHGKPTPDTADDSIGDLMPLFHAIGHACRAGLQESSYAEVLRPRIARFGTASFVIHNLGALGAYLSALDGFFECRWSTPVAAVSKEVAGHVLNSVGFLLRCLGRIDEAIGPLRAALEMASPADAGVRAENLIQAHHSHGDLEAAATVAEEAVKLSDRSGKWRRRIASRASRASISHARGRLADALQDFIEAEAIQALEEPKFPLLYSLQGTQHRDLLLDLGRFSDVRKRASKTLPWVEEEGWIFAVGLERVSQGRAEHLLSRSGRHGGERRLLHDARKHLSAAIEDLRRAGQQDYVVQGLLVRAAFNRHADYHEQAARDLEEALTAAIHIGLRLHETDARLLQGQMALDEDPPDIETAESALERVAELVNETGYHLRDADLLSLEGRLLGKKGDRELGCVKLNEAIRVARREEADGCVYQLAVDQAARYLKDVSE